MATPALRPVPSKPSILARVTAALFLLNASVSLAMPSILAWLLYRYLHRAEDVGPPLFIHWLMVLYPVVDWLWWIRMLVNVAAFSTFVAWVYVTFRDLAQRRARTRYTPSWALGGFFVPVLNLVWPYLAVRDAWRAAAGLRQQAGAGGSAGRPTPLVVKLWWALMMVIIVLAAVGGKAVMPGRMELSTVLVAWYVGAAASSLLAIAMIAAVERERLNYPAARPVGLLGPWPLPVTAGASAVLAMLLVLSGAYGLARLGMRQLASQGSVGLFSVLPPDVIPPGALPPRPPESWHVEAAFDYGHVRVRWLGSSFDLAGYNVYRREGDGAVTKINADLLQSPGFEDPHAEAGRTYHYSVSAVDRAGSETPRSLEASVTMPGEVAAEDYELRSPVRVPGEGGISGGVPGGILGGVPGGVTGGQVGGVLGGIIGGEQVPPSPTAAKGAKIRVSQSVLEGYLIHRVPPSYSPLAKMARIEGVVVLEVTVSREGRVQDVRSLSGRHPLLVQSALDAVRQWRYRPYQLNGEPVQVETTVVVTFKLPRR
jgi:TonB family protein